MFNISNLLEKIRIIQGQDASLRTLIINTIKKNTGAELLPESIVVKSSKIFLKNVSSAAKSEIFLKKNQILQEIKVTKEGANIKDIN